mgnify:CR=1 FL=1
MNSVTGKPATRRKILLLLGPVAADVSPLKLLSWKVRKVRADSRRLLQDLKKLVGHKVRRTIHELGGTMPENLPSAESIKKVESREKKRLKAG